MKKNTPQEISDILLGYLAGIQVQLLVLKNKCISWVDCEGVPCWDFNTGLYRLKPEPRKIYVIDEPSGSFGRIYFNRLEEVLDARMTLSRPDDEQVKVLQFTESQDT